MPRHIALDVNVIGGTLTFANVKTMNAYFINAQGQQVSFTEAPRLSFTVTTDDNKVAYKVANLKNGALFIGFTVGFQTKVTLELEWQAMER